MGPNKAASQGVENGTMIYRVATFEVQPPTPLTNGGRNTKTKVTIRLIYLTNEHNLEKGRRLIVNIFP